MSYNADDFGKEMKTIGRYETYGGSLEFDEGINDGTIPWKNIIIVILSIVVVILFAIVILFVGIIIFAGVEIASIVDMVKNILPSGGVTKEEYCKALKPSDIDYGTSFLGKFNNTVQYDQAISQDLVNLAMTTTIINCQNTLGTDYTTKRLVDTLNKVVVSTQKISDATVLQTGTGKNTVYWGVLYETPDYNILVWCGSSLGEQWKSDFDFLQDTLLPTDINNITGEVKVHQGFWNVYSNFRTYLVSKLSGTKKGFVCTGHSLGAAISTISMMDLMGLSNGTSIHYSFASPRVGDISFAEQFNTAISKGKYISYRVNNTEDVVPQLPLPEINGIYEHVTGSGNVPFTINEQGMLANHMNAYYTAPGCPNIECGS